MSSATARAVLSAKTPAFATGALATSPSAYTSGNRVARFVFSTGTHPSTARPEASTTADTLCFGIPMKCRTARVAVGELCDLAVRIEARDEESRHELDFARDHPLKERLRHFLRDRHRGIHRSHHADLGLLP
jgi:hypothetical protein